MKYEYDTLKHQAAIWLTLYRQDRAQHHCLCHAINATRMACMLTRSGYVVR